MPSDKTIIEGVAVPRPYELHFSDEDEEAYYAGVAEGVNALKVALLSDEALTAAARAAEAVAGAYGRPIGAGVARRIARAVLKTAGAVEREDG